MTPGLSRTSAALTNWQIQSKASVDRVSVSNGTKDQSNHRNHQAGMSGGMSLKAR
ncbi:MAG: hypothetical protein ACO3A2_03805 [Bdellovibrionia bacterium]